MPIYTSQINTYLAQQMAAMQQQQQALANRQQFYVQPPNVGSIASTAIQGATLVGGMGLGFAWNKMRRVINPEYQDAWSRMFKGGGMLLKGQAGAGSMIARALPGVAAGMLAWEAASTIGGWMGQGGNLRAANQALLSRMQFHGPRPNMIQGGLEVTREVIGLADTLGLSTREVQGVMQQFQQMGVFRQLQSVRDFRQRLRQMTHTAVQIARELGTSVNEAAAVMGQIRSMGFRSPQDLPHAVRAINQARWTTGLGMNQIMGAQMQGARLSHIIGSQMWRGAMGMTAALTTFGAAGITGLLPRGLLEEATGVMGPQAYQAMAMVSQQALAGRLMRRFGRYYLAAAATPDMRRIDEGRLAAILYGGMGINEIKRLARHRVYGREGREMGAADRILMYEEEMRGQILQQGPLALAAMIQNELGSKIYDRENWRVNRQIRREFGLNKRQADVMLRMARDLPEIMANVIGEEERRQAFQRYIKPMKATTALKRLLTKFVSGIRHSFEEMGAVADAWMEEQFSRLDRWVDESITKMLGMAQRRARRSLPMSAGATAYFLQKEKATIGYGGGGFGEGAGASSPLWSRLGFASPAAFKSIYNPDVVKAAEAAGWSAGFYSLSKLPSFVRGGMAVAYAYGGRLGAGFQRLRERYGVSGALSAVSLFGQASGNFAGAIPVGLQGEEVDVNAQIREYASDVANRLQGIYSEQLGHLIMSGKSESAAHEAAFKEASRIAGMYSINLSQFARKGYAGGLIERGAKWLFSKIGSGPPDIIGIRTKDLAEHLTKGYSQAISDPDISAALLNWKQATGSKKEVARRALMRVLSRKGETGRFLLDQIEAEINSGGDGSGVLSRTASFAHGKFVSEARRAVSGRAASLGIALSRTGLVAGKFGGALLQLSGATKLEEWLSGFEQLTKTGSLEELQGLTEKLYGAGTAGARTVALGLGQYLRSMRAMKRGDYGMLFGRFGAKHDQDTDKSWREAVRLMKKKRWSAEDYERFREAAKKINLEEGVIENITSARAGAGGEFTEEAQRGLAIEQARRAEIFGLGTTKKTMAERADDAKYFGSLPGIHSELAKHTTYLKLIAAEGLSEKNVKKLLEGLGSRLKGLNAPT